MTLRAGSFDNSKPDWRGLIRNDGAPWDGAPWYVCYHREHATRPEAAQCARKALRWMKDNPGLPDGWITYKNK